MTLRRARAVCALALFVLGAAVSGCETAPATGRTFFTGGMSAEDEVALGAKEHEKIVPEFGGAYDDPQLASYVASVGQLLAKTSELPDLKFTFTVLDSPIVNAFALPGGYVYVTRGLLSLAADEAEMAGVLAHEVGHVTARHSAERYGQAVTASIVQTGLGLLFGDIGAMAGGAVGGLALRSYSRDQEHEADLLGIRYLARAGYDPQAMATFLEHLLADSRLEAQMAGQPGKADEFNIMQTHPRTADRVELALREAGVKTVQQPMRPRDVYLQKIDGMVYGDSPKEGIVRGRRFLHSALKFSFEVPEGFQLINSPKAVAARGPQDSAIIFDQAKSNAGGSMAAYLAQVWAKGVSLKDVEAITINGMEAATGQTQQNTKQGTRDIRLVAIRYDPQTIYRFLFVTTPESTASLAEGLRATTYSFRKLSDEEAAQIKPLRIRIHTVRAGETPQSLAARMPFESFALERFLVMNGLSADSVLKTGQKVKIVTE